MKYTTMKTGSHFIISSSPGAGALPFCQCSLVSQAQNLFLQRSPRSPQGATRQGTAKVRPKANTKPHQTPRRQGRRQGRQTITVGSVSGFRRGVNVASSVTISHRLMLPTKIWGIGAKPAVWPRARTRLDRCRLSSGMASSRRNWRFRWGGGCLRLGARSASLVRSWARSFVGNRVA